MFTGFQIMFSRREYLLAGLFVAVLALFFVARGCDKRIDRKTVDTTLPVGTIEKLVINPNTHKLTVITPGKEETLFLPDRPSSIEINKNGTVNVTSKQFGTELKPFIGFQVSNMFRLAFGLDLMYYKKLDLGLGVADKVGNYTPVGFVALSYNVYSNSQIGLTYDSSSHIGVAVTVRL